ncbi:MAG: hypothetical protein JWN35_1861 [Frankiales bacterium]|jgi:hypothetical protein|nr:hypothetical protein [Frankiales bacterium]
MRHATPIAAAVLLAITVTGGAAYADATDVLLATPAAGVLSLAGVGAQVSTSPTIGTTGASVGTTALQVTDATGSNCGWVVTAKYGSVTLGTGQADLGGDNVLLKAAPVGTNAAGVATADATWAGANADQVLGSGTVSVVATHENAASAGRGVTDFTVGYRIKIPTKSSKSLAYTGQVVYTVAPGLTTGC